MIDIKFDLRDFERASRQIGGAADQVPFALAGALNTALFNTRKKLVTETWPKSVTVRNRSFLSAALRVETATKGKLEGAIFDSMGRAHLGLHARGGTKRPARGMLAIPTARVRRTARGVAANQKPSMLKRSVRKGNLIFQETGRGKAKRLELMYKLAPMARIKKDVPFVEDFRRSMLAEVRVAFPAAMAKAMRTRR
ncbi:hypothetical protein [Chelatococcus reniformis]|uniref:Uncharacterized protein n=1 Tax=Chelatococcus reniformis TaxID=1494448 RepID=A0A916UWQ3_9HYPH|nr:hypothetical protein [Chelatococcus reniformis]GGC90483.1 hypothetical protein GCM10010994_55390 [Chelatococcus reniformis]